MMKEITVENFNYSNVKEWIEDYSHKEKVEFAIYCAELVIDSYAGTSEAPKRAIQAAKDWILNPSKENKQKCKDTADAADYATAAGAAAAGAAAYYTAADAAAYAAYAAGAAGAAGGRSIKDKIISYINNKIPPQTKEVEWVNGDRVVIQNPEGFGTWDEANKYLGAEGVVMAVFENTNGKMVAAVSHNDNVCICWMLSMLSKPETPEAKKEREELEAAYDLYCDWLIGMEYPKSLYRPFIESPHVNAMLAIVRKTGYRKESE